MTSALASAEPLVRDACLHVCVLKYWTTLHTFSSAWDLRGLRSDVGYLSYLWCISVGLWLWFVGGMQFKTRLCWPSYYISLFSFFSFFMTCFTLTATCLVCNKYTQEGGAVFEQESKQFSTTVKMCSNTNKNGINYYVYGQEYVKNFWNYYICLFKFDFSPKSMSQFSTISKPPWIYAANNTPCMILFLYKHRNTRFKQNE